MFFRLITYKQINKMKKLYWMLSKKQLKKMKKIYRTIIRFEILSEEPIAPSSLNEIDGQCFDGEWSGQMIEEEIQNEELIGEKAIEAIKNQGSNPLFFNMDENGKEIE